MYSGAILSRERITSALFFSGTFTSIKASAPKRTMIFTSVFSFGIFFLSIFTFKIFLERGDTVPDAGVIERQFESHSTV